MRDLVVVALMASALGGIGWILGLLTTVVVAERLTTLVACSAASWLASALAEANGEPDRAAGATRL